MFDSSSQRMQALGAVLIVAGLGVAGAGFLYGMPLASKGLESAVASYEDQGVTLNYNDEGELVDRGSPEQAQEILSLLTDTWKFPLNERNLDPDDPLINTRDEVMYQYAVITFHVLHGEVDVVLEEEDVPITYRGVEYTDPGTYQIAPMAYYAELDRTHPIEGQLREAWSPLALSLNAYLAAGHANQAAGELAWFTSFGMGGVGLLFALSGVGLVWIGRSRDLSIDG